MKGEAVGWEDRGSGRTANAPPEEGRALTVGTEKGSWAEAVAQVTDSDFCRGSGAQGSMAFSHCTLQPRSEGLGGQEVGATRARGS